MTKLEQLRAAINEMTDAPWRWDGLDLRSPGSYRVFQISGYEAAADMAGVVALRNAAPQLLALWAACQAARAAVCDGSCEEGRHDSACPIAIARAAVTAVLERGLP